MFYANNPKKMPPAPVFSAFSLPGAAKSVPDT
jgi:hypothetical protein